MCMSIANFVCREQEARDRQRHPERDRLVYVWLFAVDVFADTVLLKKIAFTIRLSA